MKRCCGVEGVSAELSSLCILCEMRGLAGWLAGWHTACYAWAHPPHDPVLPRPPQVRIVRERSSGKIMAMKKLRKSEMLRRGQVRGWKAGA